MGEHVSAFPQIRHNFRDTVNPMRPTSDDIEDTEQFLFLCLSFDACLTARSFHWNGWNCWNASIQNTDLSNDYLTQFSLYSMVLNTFPMT